MYHRSITAVPPASIGDGERCTPARSRESVNAAPDRHHNSVQPFGQRLSQKAERLREQAETVPSGI
jgi:hypothetical protein